MDNLPDIIITVALLGIVIVIYYATNSSGVDYTYIDNTSIKGKNRRKRKVYVEEIELSKDISERKQQQTDFRGSSSLIKEKHPQC